MSIAHKCDRCGKFYANRPLVIDGISPGVPLDSIQLTAPNKTSYNTDLCQECLEDFARWTNKEDKTNG